MKTNKPEREGCASEACDRTARKDSPFCYGCGKVLEYWADKPNGQRVAYQRNLARRTYRIDLISDEKGKGKSRNKVVDIRSRRRA